jgi:hypothetical protein
MSTAAASLADKLHVRPRCLQDKVKLNRDAPLAFQASSPAVGGAINSGNGEYISAIVTVSNHDTNPSNNIRHLSAVSDQAPAAPVASNDSLNDGTFAFQCSHSHNMMPSPDNNATISTVQSNWSASVETSMLTGNAHSFQPQSDAMFASNREGVQLASEYTCPHNIIHAPSDPPGQYNDQGTNPGLDTDMNLYTDYNAYCTVGVANASMSHLLLFE